MNVALSGTSVFGMAPKNFYTDVRRGTGSSISWLTSAWDSMCFTGMAGGGTSASGAHDDASTHHVDD
jgi:hypothetical protein